MPKIYTPLIILGIVLAVLLLVGARLYKAVPAGHVAVATFFGEVVPQPYASGLHIPVNPLYEWKLFDIREDTITEMANVPSQDQLQTTIDVSVRFSVNEALTPDTLQRFGEKDRLVQKQLVPSLRSKLREAGKSIERAEDFFNETTQERLQDYLLSELKADLEPKGLNIDRVLIRSIELPQFIMSAIEAKKEREQAVERQKAELERFRTEQQQKIAQAEAEREAAEQQAQMRRLLADARAYEIEKVNTAIASNPAYVQLQALEALKEISKDDSSKIYFLNGESPQPLPLMNIGESIRAQR